MLPKQLSEKRIGEILLRDQLVRREITKNDIFWFFRIYFSHYITHQIADFQIEILRLVQDDTLKRVVITAFRNSGKSTFCSLVAPIWYIVGFLQKKYIVIVCSTQERAKQTFSNLKQELEKNELLKNDFGPFDDHDDEWNAYSIVIPRYDARITVISVEEKIRGLRHKQYRPQVFIIDDVEDPQSARLQESRDKLWHFINGELLPAGDDAKAVFIGNLVHNDSLMMRLRQIIENKKMSGVFRSYPLFEEETKKINWIGKFPTFTEIEKLKNSLPSEEDYLREYMLKIIPRGLSIIKPEWIKYYSEIPSITSPDFRCIAVGIDLAIKETEESDFTSFIAAYIFGREDKLRVYIASYLINEKMDFPTTVEKLEQYVNYLGNKSNVKIFIEDVGYQKAFVDELQKKNYQAEGVLVGNRTKKERLKFVSPYVKVGRVLFSKIGNEDLVNQLVYFGVEKHDDLADAFSILIEKIIEDDKPYGGPFVLQLEKSIYPSVEIEE